MSEWEKRRDEAIDKWIEEKTSGFYIAGHFIADRSSNEQIQRASDFFEAGFTAGRKDALENLMEVDAVRVLVEVIERELNSKYKVTGINEESDPSVLSVNNIMEWSELGEALEQFKKSQRSRK